MSAISPESRAKIKGHLEGFVEILVKRYKQRSFPGFTYPRELLTRMPSKQENRLRPFHAAIIPPELRRISAFERGFSTSLGTTFEECARLIALEHHHEAYRNYALTGRVSLAAINEIEHQVALFESASSNDADGVKPDFEQMIGAVLAACREDDLEERTVRADLFIRARDGTEFYFEMKSPDPNKGQCLEVTQRLLRFHLMRQRPRPAVRAYISQWPIIPMGHQEPTISGRSP